MVVAGAIAGDDVAIIMVEAEATADIGCERSWACDHDRARLHRIPALRILPPDTLRRFGAWSDRAIVSFPKLTVPSC